jgi:hypothetical protein
MDVLFDGNVRLVNDDTVDVFIAVEGVANGG